MLSCYPYVMIKMASALADKIDQDFLQCGICLEPFKNPRGLPCLHSFCEECLIRWSKTHRKGDSKVLTCPNCMKSTAIPAEGIAGFPAHVLVNSLQETLNMEKVNKDLSPKSCDQCEEPDKMASVYCKDCKHYLCESCQTFHKAWKSMKHHKIISVADISSGKENICSIEEQYSGEHDNEEKKLLYCETCDKQVCRNCIVLKQCCREHDTVTLKQAADKKSNELKVQMKKCKEKKQECQHAIDQIEKIEKTLSSSSDQIRHRLKTKKAAYMKVVESVFDTVLSNVDSFESKVAKNLSENKKSITENITEIDSTNEEGENLIATGSNSEIVSKYTPMSCSLQKITQQHVDKVNDKMVESILKIPIPVVTVTQQRKHVRSMPFGDKLLARGIAVTSDEKIVVDSKVYSLYWNLHVLHTFQKSASCVCITSSDAFVIASSKTCNLYNNKYKFLNKFETRDTNSQLHTAKAVTVDKQGCIIILGMTDYETKNHTISIYSTDGALQATFATSIEPKSLAVTSKEEIVIADSVTLQLLDFTGKCLHTIEPPPEVTTWKPTHVCCSTKDDVFVVNRGDPKAIYMYAAGRVYMGCITTEVKYPWGIAISHNDHKLFVGDNIESSKYVVNIFQAP